jgi:demethylmenaquinone methyltransferase/2-methoxy-6-polyprenyl-1,4-benzoquinol methylase
MALPTTVDKNKEKLVNDLFTRIANNYDRVNNMMTFFFHYAWKQKAINECKLKSRGSTVLDLCTGTGDMAFMWTKNEKVAEIYAIDTCDEMLDIAKAKLKKRPEDQSRVQFAHGDALDIPFEDNTFDAITVGYGLRNVSNLKHSLKEIKRVLKPGGCIASLDLGHPPFPMINKLYKKILRASIPKLGSSQANDQAAYQYLVESLDNWPDQRTLSQMFYDEGFSRSYFKDIFLGSMAIVVAEK